MFKASRLLLVLQGAERKYVERGEKGTFKKQGYRISGTELLTREACTFSASGPPWPNNFMLSLHLRNSLRCLLGPQRMHPKSRQHGPWALQLISQYTQRGAHVTENLVFQGNIFPKRPQADSGIGKHTTGTSTSEAKALVCRRARRLAALRWSPGRVLGLVA